MIRPDSEAALTEAIRTASVPLSIRGGHTRGAAPEGTPLSLSGIAGLRDYRPEALTLTVAAGTPLAEVEAALDEAGQILPFEPPDIAAITGGQGPSTIGGVIADNAAGPRRVLAGAARDVVLGVRFVDGTGQAHRFGGPVMKNVSGYDIARLMAGSRGQLGAITEVTLKTLPKPPQTAVLLLEGLSIAEAVRAMTAALATPWEVSGAAHLPVGPRGDPVTMIRLEGRAEQIHHRLPLLRKRLEGFGPLSVEDGQGSPQEGGTDAGWAFIRNLHGFAERSGDLWRVSTKPDQAETLIDRAQPRHAQLDWGGALLWLLVAPGTDLRARLGAYAGHARLVRADPDTLARLPRFEPEAPGLARLADALRRRFDPMGRFGAPQNEVA